MLIQESKQLRTIEHILVILGDTSMVEVPWCDIHEVLLHVASYPFPCSLSWQCEVGVVSRNEAVERLLDKLDRIQVF
jgi:hypothetical protein